MSFESINNVSRSYETLVQSFQQLVLVDHKPGFVAFVSDCVRGQDAPSVNLNEKIDLFLYSVQDDSEVSAKIAMQITQFASDDPSMMIAMAFQLCLFLAASDAEAAETFKSLQPLLQLHDSRPDALQELVRLLLEENMPFSQLVSLLQITAHVYSEVSFCGWNALEIGEFTLFFSGSLLPALSKLDSHWCERALTLYEMILPTTDAKTDQKYLPELYEPLQRMLKSESTVVSSVGFSLLSTFSQRCEPAAAAYRFYLPKVVAGGLVTDSIAKPAFTMLLGAIKSREYEVAAYLIQILFSRYTVAQIAARMDVPKEVHSFFVTLAPNYPDILHYLVDKKLTPDEEKQLVEEWPKLIESNRFYEECMRETHFGIHLLKKGAPADVVKAVVFLKARNSESCYLLFMHKKFAECFEDDPEYLASCYLSYVEVTTNTLERRILLLKMAYRAVFQADVGELYLRLSQNILTEGLALWPLIEKLREFDMEKEALELVPSATCSGYEEQALVWCEALLQEARFTDLEEVFTVCRLAPDFFPMRQARIVLELAKRGSSVEKLTEFDLSRAHELFFEILEYASSTHTHLLGHFLGQLANFTPHLSHNRDTVVRAISASQPSEALLETLLVCMPEAALELVDRVEPSFRTAALLIKQPNATLRAKACRTLIEAITTTAQQQELSQIEYSQFFAYPECAPWREELLQALAPFTSIYYKLLLSLLQKSPTDQLFAAVKKQLRKALERKKQPEPEAVSYARECLELFFSWNPPFDGPLLLGQCRELQWVKQRITAQQSILEEYIAPRIHEKLTAAILDGGAGSKNFFETCEREGFFEGNFELFCQLHLFTHGSFPTGKGQSLSDQRILEARSTILFKLLQRLAATPKQFMRFAEILRDHHAFLDKNQLSKCCSLFKTTIKPIQGRWQIQKRALEVIDTIPEESARASIHKQLEQKL